MNYTITINVETPEELLGAINRLASLGAAGSSQVLSPGLPFNQPAGLLSAQEPIQTHVAPQQVHQAYQQQSFQQPSYGQAPAYGQQPVQQQYVQQPGQPVVAQQQQAPTGQVPVVSAPTYTMEVLGVAAGPIIDAGRSQELLAWINQRGAGALSQLDKSHYGDFATYLRSLGAKI